MFCGSCGGKLDGNGLCSNCAQQVMTQPVVETVPKENKNNNKKIIIIVAAIGVILVALLVFLFFFNNSNGDDKKRSETLVNLGKNEYLKFTLGVVVTCINWN